MDPAGYDTQFLPRIQYGDRGPPKIYNIKEGALSQYSEFLDHFTWYLENKCWAIAVNDEILYNGYIERTFRETILENMIIDKLHQNPESLFSDIKEKRKDVKIVLYMGGYEPYFVILHHYVSQEQIIVTEYS